MKLLRLCLEATQNFFLSHAKSVLVLLIPLVFSSFYFSTKTKIAVRTEDFSNKSLPSFKDMQSLKRDYSFEDKFTLLINKNAPLNQNDLCAIYGWLINETENNENIVQTSSLFDLRLPSLNDGKLFYPKVISDPCRENIDFNLLKRHPLSKMFSAEDFSDTIIHFDIRPSKAQFRHGIYDYQIIKDMLTRAQRTLPYEILPAGSLFFQSSVLDGIYHSNLINIIAIILLLSLYYFFYRSLIFCLFLLTIIVVTNSTLKAGMGLLDHLIDPLSSCIFLMITVAILEDFILISYMLFKRKLSFDQTMKSLLVPSFLTSLTTAIGFGSLAISENPSIVHFSIWTALGAIFEWIALFLILPSIIKLFPKLKRNIENQARPRSYLPNEFISFRPKRVLTLIIAIVPFSLFLLHNNANLHYSPFDMFPSDHSISKFRSHILKTRNTEGEISVLFSNKDTDLSPYIEEFKKHPLVSSVFSENDILNEVRSEYDPALYTLIRDDFRRTSTGQFFTSNYSKRIIISVKSYDSKNVPMIVHDLKKICRDHCTLTSEIITSSDYANEVLKTLTDSFFGGFSAILILIGFVIWMTLKRNYIPILISTIWASLSLLLIVIVFQIKINFVTCVALSVLIGAAGDNAIQFLLFNKGSLSKTVGEIGEASLEHFILMILLSSSLIFSYFATPRDLSILLIIGVCLMFIGDIWVLNGLIDDE